MAAVTPVAGSCEHTLAPPMLLERLEAEIAGLERALESGEPMEPSNRWTAADRRVLPVGPVEIARELRFLRKLHEAMVAADPGPLWVDRVGFGTAVLVQYMETGAERVHKLILGSPDPLDLAQIALDSPVGRALLGASRGDWVRVADRNRPQDLKILHIKTLADRLGIMPSRGGRATGKESETGPTPGCGSVVE